jgi:hypothetical protein
MWVPVQPKFGAHQLLGSGDQPEMLSLSHGDDVPEAKPVWAQSNFRSYVKGAGTCLDRSARDPGAGRSATSRRLHPAM